MGTGLDGKHPSVAVFTKVLPAISPLHGSLVASCGIRDALTEQGLWEPGTCRRYSLPGREEGLLCCISLCFGAGRLAAITLPMGLPDPVAGAMAALQPALLWCHVLAMRDDWGRRN